MRGKRELRQRETSKRDDDEDSPADLRSSVACCIEKSLVRCVSYDLRGPKGNSSHPTELETYDRVSVQSSPKKTGNSPQAKSDDDEKS